MADETTETTEVVTVDTDVKAEIEKLKSQLSEKDAKLSELESMKSELIETRQKAKERERQALEEQGQYKAISEEQAKELEKLRTEFDTYKSDAEQIKAKAEEWDQYQDTRRAELIEMLPEGKREKFQSAPLDLLQETVELIGLRTPVSKASASRRGDTAKKWHEMDDAERVAAMETLESEELAKIMTTK